MSVSIVFADININPFNNISEEISNTVNHNKTEDEKVFFKRSNKENDPIKVLEGLKKQIQKRLKDREITEEKAKELNSRIDNKIDKIKEFNKLSLKEKKSKLISDLESRLEEKVVENKISQEKADEIIKEKTEKIQNWDGKSYPKFIKRYFFEDH